MAGWKQGEQKASFNWNEDANPQKLSHNSTSAGTSTEPTKHDEPKKQEPKKQEPKKQEPKKQEPKKQDTGSPNVSAPDAPAAPDVSAPEVDIPTGAPGVGPGGKSDGNNDKQESETSKEKKDLTVQIIFSSISYYNFVKEQGVQAITSNKPYKVNEPTLHFEESWPPQSYAYEKECDDVIFVDISNEETKLFSSKYKFDDPLMKHVGFAIMQLNDMLLRWTRQGYYGNVHCQLISVNPCQKNMAAMSALLGKILKDTELYSKFITKVLKQEEYKSTFKWIRTYGWSFFVDYNAAFTPYAAHVENDKSHIQRADDMQRVLGNQEGMVSIFSLPRANIWESKENDTKKWDPEKKMMVPAKKRRVDDDGQYWVVYEGTEYKYEELKEKWRKIVHPNKAELTKDLEDAEKAYQEAIETKKKTEDRLAISHSLRNDETTQQLIDNEVERLKQNKNFKDKSDKEIQAALAQKGLIPLTDKDFNPKDESTLPLEKGYSYDGRLITWKDEKKIRDELYKNEQEAFINREKAKTALEIWHIQHKMFFINAGLCVVQALCLGAPAFAAADLILNVWLRVEETKLYDLTDQKHSTGDNIMFGVTIFFDILALTPYFIKAFNPKVTMKIKNPDGSAKFVTENKGKQMVKHVDQGGNVTKIEYANKGAIEKVEVYEEGLINNTAYYENGKLNKMEFYSEGKVYKVQHFENGHISKTDFIEEGTVTNTIHADRVSVIQDGNDAIVQYTSNQRITRMDYYKDNVLYKSDIYKEGHYSETVFVDNNKPLINNKSSINIDSLMAELNGQSHVKVMDLPEINNKPVILGPDGNPARPTGGSGNSKTLVPDEKTILGPNGETLSEVRTLHAEGNFLTYPNPDASPLQRLDDVLSQADNINGSPASRMGIHNQEISHVKELKYLQSWKHRWTLNKFKGDEELVYSAPEGLTDVKFQGGWKTQNGGETISAIVGPVNSAYGVYSGFMLFPNVIGLMYNDDEKAQELYKDVGSTEMDKEIEKTNEERENEGRSVHANNHQEYNDEVLPLSSIDAAKLDEQSNDMMNQIDENPDNYTDMDYFNALDTGTYAGIARARQDEALQEKNDAMDYYYNYDHSVDNNGGNSSIFDEYDYSEDVNNDYDVNVADSVAQGAKVDLQHTLYLQMHQNDD